MDGRTRKLPLSSDSSNVIGKVGSRELTNLPYLLQLLYMDACYAIKSQLELEFTAKKIASCSNSTLGNRDSLIVIVVKSKKKEHSFQSCPTIITSLYNILGSLHPDPSFMPNK
jgi:hypothetical protein